MHLAFDISLEGLPLSMKGIKLKVQAMFGGLASVNRTPADLHPFHAAMSCGRTSFWSRPSRTKERWTVPVCTGDNSGDGRQAGIDLLLPDKATRHDVLRMPDALKVPNEHRTGLQALAALVAGPFLPHFLQKFHCRPDVAAIRLFLKPPGQRSQHGSRHMPLGAPRRNSAD